MRRLSTDHSLRTGISLFELLIVLALLTVLAAFLTLALLVNREGGRRTQCTNNLKQIGLAVHNFHDTFNGLPPLTIGKQRAGFVMPLMPFAEAHNPDSGLFIGRNEDANTDYADRFAINWSKLTAPGEQEHIASIKWMQCPSRRSGVQRTSNRAAGYDGPTGDYAVVFIDQDPLKDMSPIVFLPFPPAGDNGWVAHQDPCDDTEVERQRGAIRLAMIDCDADPPPADPHAIYRAWKPRDSFARVTDGLSSTLFVGEKHVRSGELNRYADDGDRQDGVYLHSDSSGRMSAQVARSIRHPFADGATDPKFKLGIGKDPQSHFGFGSWHADVIPFLRGDGSVVDIDVGIDFQVKCKYGHAQESTFDVVR